MGMAPTLTKDTMMSTKMNIFNPPPHGLLKDAQDQNNGNCSVRPSESASQEIITQPIFTSLLNEKITAKTIGNGSIISNYIAFSLKVPPVSS